MLDPNRTPDDYADDFVHELLSPDEAATFEKQCQADEAWQRALEDAQKRKAVLESVPPSEANEKLVRQTMDNIHHKVERRAKSWKVFSRSVLGLAAVAVLLIAACHLYFYTLKPSPYDVRVLGQNSLLSGTPAALRVAVFNERTGQEMHGVPVTLVLFDAEKSEKIELGSFKSGEDIAARLQLPDWDDGDYQLRVIASPNGNREELTQSLSLRREWKLMLSSDKPLYQPGQTIHLRALALRKPDLKPVADERMTFTIADPKGNIIFKQEAKGSEYGIAAADCALAREILLGPYLITCRIGETVSEQTVTVDKYVLPKFGVAVTLDKPFYAPGDEVNVTVQSDYFFGQPVAGATVQLEALSQDVQLFNIASITEKTNDKGQAELSFILPNRLIGREQDGGAAHFTVAATVTDAADQSQTADTRRVVTMRPIELDVIPEAGALVKGVANKVYLYASYVDGRPAKVDVNINDGQHEARTSKLGVAEIEVTPTGDGEHGLTLVAKDDAGRTVRQHFKLAVGKVASDFVVRTDKATYDGGETMTLVAAGGGVEPVFVDFLKDGQTMLTTSVEMQDGRGERQLDLPPELFGTIKLVAYRFGAGGLPVRKSRMIVVRQARQLTIAATLDKDEYRPGASAKLNLKLTDADGKAVPGAISLAAVDEAVFALLKQRPGMEEVFFLLEQELLQPVYAVYNYDPFAAPDAPPEVIQFERAIFSRTAAVAQGEAAVPGAFASPQERRKNFRGGPDFAVEESIAFDPQQENVNYVADESPFSLAGASYPDKVDRVWRQRRGGLEAVTIAWWSLAGLLVVVGWVTAAVYKPFWTLTVSSVLMAIGVVGVCLLALILPTAHNAREVADFAVGNAAPQAAMDFAAEAGGIDTFVTAEPEDVGVDDAPTDDTTPEKPAVRPRVRKDFPETLLWRPQIITDEHGNASIDIQLADSITAWRVTASAVSGQGQLGGMTEKITVFQPFFVDFDLPVALTRNDQIRVPVVVHNYLNEPQTVKLELEAADWFARVDDVGAELDENPAMEVELAAGEKNKAVYIPIRVKNVGKQELQVTATGSNNVGDAIRRQIEVVADGLREEQVVSGTLDGPADVALSLPENTIPGSPRAIVKLYPTSFSQLVEGLDAIFQMPSGCFEQTSSTTYPNILALKYLRDNKLSAPEVEAKARQYIHVGYQRLVSFEVAGGGFDWFGNPPANETLSAYGLLEFEDMAHVYDVDRDLIDRTRGWLLSRRQPDGRWKADPNMLNDGLAGSVLTGDDLDLAATAYIAWAVFGGGAAKGRSQVTLDYLLAREPATIKSPYMLALIANCIAGIDKNHSALGEYTRRLDEMKETSADGKQVWWTQVEGERTMFYGDGRSGDIETTAMAALALKNAGDHPASLRGALTWLVGQKDARGTWHSTQATVLALKALIEASGAALRDEQPRKIDIAVDGKVIRTVEILVDQAEVMQQINLTDSLVPGEQKLTLTDVTETGTGYQVAFWYHTDEVAAPPPVDAAPDPLTVNINYNRRRLAVDDHVGAAAVVVNNTDAALPMVILDLPIPGGFEIEPGELDELVGERKIAKYQITPRKAVIYLRQLAPGEQLELNYRLKATMPVKVAVPPGTAYEYYNPDIRGISKPALLEAALDA